MKQLFIVMKETYFRHVKSWSFLFMVLSPFIFLGFSVGMGVLVGMSQFSSDPVPVVSASPEIKQVLEEDKYNFDYKDQNAAQKAVDEGDIDGYLILDVKEHQVYAAYHGKESMDRFAKEDVLARLKSLQADLNHEEAQLTENQEKILSQEIIYDEVIKKDTELIQAIQSGFVFILSIALYMFLIVYSTTTAQDIANEKGTKIMEVIFSSVRASNYFYGRMLGIVAVVLTHILIYVVGFLLAYLVAGQIPIVQMFLDQNQEMIALLFQPSTVYTIFFMLLGLIFYIVLSAACGALVTRVEDVNKAVQPIVLLVVVAMMMSVTLGVKGENILLTIGSYIPFFSPFFMSIRLIHEEASNLEGLLSLFILLGTTAGSIWYIGKIYARLILQTDDLGLWKNLQRVLKEK
ncbi:ABC transporter permease [Streptococcus cuniculi]|uniref:ABC transporter permease n=1 Tax=Streptococcus cuniculi TaxID=1432788 RepID=A0A4Y9JF99_9STRE|nr:ABC transporter permease [Streptococcus cuniculi]MBF0777337.1 ABC transporter permease [Streptococcus cuniculi]TFU98938.1 ABC transporter permease [Streptococcus cuniculi]